ncbi:MAG: hypothetical protein R3D87_10620 [Paracoccaceae bacterium]
MNELEKDSEGAVVSRRRALVRIGALALAAYSIPAVTTLAQAHASGGGSGGGDGGGSGGGGGGSHSSGSSGSSGSTSPSHSSTDDSGTGCADSTDASCSATTN